jgi:predicted transcriptional regulator
MVCTGIGSPSKRTTRWSVGSFSPHRSLNRDLLRVIAEKAPGSLDELARITGNAKSNLSRTLRTMEGYGLVRLERGERGRISPKVVHDRVELDLPLTLSRKAS